MARNYDYLFKVVLIGDSGVGKTSILKRYRANEFSDDTKHTIGVEFATQELEIEDKLVKTQIWDTAGQERYRAITKAYYRGALGAILVYDITDRNTFESLKRWYNEIETNAAKDIKVMLVGNKKDMEHKREVGVDEGKAFAKANGLAFLEASAKSGDLVVTCFETIVKQIFSAQAENDVIAKKKSSSTEQKQLLAEPIGVNLSSESEQKAKSACCPVS